MRAPVLRDAARDEAMRRQGWRVLRSWNNEVLENLQGVLADIARVPEEQKGAQARGPTPALPRERGREEGSREG